MDHLDLQTLKTARDWRAAGHRVVLGTVTRTWRSAARPVGSMLALRDDGALAGSLASGPIERDLAVRIMDGSVAADTPERLRYRADGEAAADDDGPPAGELLELVLEPITPASQLDALLVRLARGERVRRTLDLEDGSVMLSPAGPGNNLQLDGGLLITTHLPG